MTTSSADTDMKPAFAKLESLLGLSGVQSDSGRTYIDLACKVERVPEDDGMGEAWEIVWTLTFPTIPTPALFRNSEGALVWRAGRNRQEGMFFSHRDVAEVVKQATEFLEVFINMRTDWDEREEMKFRQAYGR